MTQLTKAYAAKQIRLQVTTMKSSSNRRNAHAMSKLTGGVSATLKYKFIPKMLPAIATNATATVTMLSTYALHRQLCFKIMLLMLRETGCLQASHLFMLGNSLY